MEDAGEKASSAVQLKGNKDQRKKNFLQQYFEAFNIIQEKWHFEGESRQAADVRQEEAEEVGWLSPTGGSQWAPGTQLGAEVTEQECI